MFCFRPAKEKVWTAKPWMAPEAQEEGGWRAMPWRYEGVGGPRPTFVGYKGPAEASSSSHEDPAVPKRRPTPPSQPPPLPAGFSKTKQIS